ncbi:MAG: biotin transporter BioY [Cyanobacteria bacterium P01_F01_bin.33]
MKRPVLPSLFELLWMAIGALLTAAGTLLQIPIPHGVLPMVEWNFEPVYVLSFQLVGWMITAGVAGARAACWSQIAYLTLGFLGWGVFTYDSGWQTFQQPSFGYLLGFVPGAWLCGRTIERVPQPSLSWLATSCLAGLGVVHICGLTYLLVRGGGELGLAATARQYSLYLLVGQIALIPAVVGVIAIARRILFINGRFIDGKFIDGKAARDQRPEVRALPEHVKGEDNAW